MKKVSAATLNEVEELLRELKKLKKAADQLLKEIGTQTASLINSGFSFRPFKEPETKEIRVSSDGKPNGILIGFFDPDKRNDWSKPWNDLRYKNDPLAPWNDLFADEKDYETYCRRNLISKWDR